MNLADPLRKTQVATENTTSPSASGFCENERVFASDGTCLFSPDGRRLIRCIAEPITYCVPKGVTQIEPRAFAFQRKLKQVELPEGLLSIGDEAFCACNALSHINMPESVHAIGTKALFCTAFTNIHLPAALDRIGDMALVSIASLQDGSRQGPGSIPLPSITVDTGNLRFFVDCGFLCERGDDDKTRAIRYAGNNPVVRIPNEVTHVCSYALLGAKATRALHLHTHIEHVGINAILTYQPIDYICVDLPNDATLMLYPAESCRAFPNSLFCGPEGIIELARTCDASLTTMKQGPGRTRRIIERMLNGRLMKEQHRVMFRNALERELDASILQFSRLDDETSLRGLVALGVINGRNIEHAVETANRTGSVIATRALLDESQGMRRTRSALSLDL